MTDDRRLGSGFTGPDVRALRTVMFVVVAVPVQLERQPRAAQLGVVDRLFDEARAVASREVPDVAVMYAGDGVLLVFDADDATAAVNTAIRVHEAIVDSNAFGMAVKNASVFACATGISTGEVVVASASGSRMDFVGPAVHMAAELGALANAGAVLVDGPTLAAADLTRIGSRRGRAVGWADDRYTTVEQVVTLRGFDQPFAYHEILWDLQPYGTKPQAPTADTRVGLHENPESIGQLFRRHYDLVDQLVDLVTDEEVDGRLRQVLNAAGYCGLGRSEDLTGDISIDRGNAPQPGDRVQLSCIPARKRPVDRQRIDRERDSDVAALGPRTALTVHADTSGPTMSNSRLWHGRFLVVFTAAAAMVLVVAVGLAMVAIRGFRPGNVPGSSPVASVASAGADRLVGSAVCPTTNEVVLRPLSPDASWPALIGGWVWYQDPSGYRVAVPAGWLVTSGTSGSCFREAGDTRWFGVTTWTAVGSPMEHVAEQPTLLHSESLPGYQSISTASVPYFQGGADWEFRFMNHAGTGMHCLLRDFVVAPGRGYTITWCTTEADWTTNLDNFRLVIASFIPA